MFLFASTNTQTVGRQQFGNDIKYAPGGNSPNVIVSLGGNGQVAIVSDDRYGGTTTTTYAHLMERTATGWKQVGSSLKYLYQ